MKNLIYILILMFLVSGCYTLINHPEVEIYYERENGEEYLTEEYDVMVDEDCTTCHDSFLAQKHFSPLIPAHNLNSNWGDLPWWLDNKYLMFFEEPRDSSDGDSGDSGYRHVNTQKRDGISSIPQSGYVPSSGGSATSSGGAAGSTMNTSRSQSPNEDDGNKNGSKVNKQRSDNNSSSSGNRSSSSKRKFRKRK